ncbi:MAG: glycosyltransferase family 4 protein [Elusimicrobia bacterium]|nr:glycosyltransferase family 4 protein [Elusimicrobiota bacterium]
MRIALVVPDPADPAHAALLRGLGGALRRRGHGVGRGLAGAPPDVIHLHVFSRGCSRLASLRLPEGCALVVTSQGASRDLIDDRASFSRLLRRADAVTAVSRAGLAQLRSAGFSVPNGTETGRAAAPRAGPDFLTVGRLAAYKGLDVMALAFAGLPGRPVWTVVGPDQTGGRFAAFLARLGVADRVVLTGSLPPGRVRRLMDSARVFVQPSRAENMPMALLEAMASGAACAASDIPGCRETLGRAGRFFRAGDARALGRVLGGLLADPALRRELGARARRRAEAFTWDAAARRYEVVYEYARARARPRRTCADQSPLA